MKKEIPGCSSLTSVREGNEKLLHFYKSSAILMHGSKHGARHMEVSLP